MVTQRRQPSFSEIVDAVKATPAATPPESDRPGVRADGQIIDPLGRAYTETARDISSAAAHDAAAAGAQVAWDPCGCGGYCGLRWFDVVDVARMVVAGRPNIRRTKKAYGSISEYRGEDGRVLLLVEADVRWGDFLA
ncbi:hypothetical protein [Cellulomonas sp. Root137]|uniref:hypothetical protein n=1 Tax=Cellulomonas sp. Root137 TaxID=1736459 RepID=UPI0006F80CBD|nr:hypothetical protein [Cellulomonas sp. Root137]KQY42851.1 hypothetical protein ASD18_17850 [Cellulomonas sp. Root137]